MCENTTGDSELSQSHLRDSVPLLPEAALSRMAPPNQELSGAIYASNHTCFCAKDRRGDSLSRGVIGMVWEMPQGSGSQLVRSPRRDSVRQRRMA